MTIQELQQASSQDKHLQQLKEHIKGLSENKNQIPQDMRTLIFCDDMAVTDTAIQKGRQVVIHEMWQTQALEQLHINHMEIQKTKCLVYKSIYWIGMNNDIEKNKKLFYLS